QTLGDPVADQILSALQAHPDGLSRTQIRDLFHGNRGKDETERALQSLASHNHARVERGVPDGPGRPTETWFACTARNRTASAFRSFRSFLSYPEDPLAGPDGSRGDSPSPTTETRNSDWTEHPTASGEPHAAPWATTETTKTTKSGGVG